MQNAKRSADMILLSWANGSSRNQRHGFKRVWCYEKFRWRHRELKERRVGESGRRWRIGGKDSGKSRGGRRKKERGAWVSGVWLEILTLLVIREVNEDKVLGCCSLCFGNQKQRWEIRTQQGGKERVRALVRYLDWHMHGRDEISFKWRCSKGDPLNNLATSWQISIWTSYHFSFSRFHLHFQ